jgi:general secretion pathway protein F
MPNFRYRALTQSGEVVSGLLAAKTAQEVARRMDYLSLVPIEAIVVDETARPRIDFKIGNRISAEDITTFTLDLALLLKAGARLDDALGLLGDDIDSGRFHVTMSTIRSRVISGESFAEALAGHPKQFPPLYVALVSIGETSGALADMLQMLARERARDEALRRKIGDALRYPAFLLFAAACVLMFFLTFVLPQFGAVLRDFGAEIDPVAKAFIWLSESLIARKDEIAVLTMLLLAGVFLAARQAKLRIAIKDRLVRMPLIRTVAAFHQTALFCRNLDILLAAAVPLTTTLRVLADLMDGRGTRTIWSRVMERVRQGGRLSDAIEEARALPATAIRMLRLGEETGQLALLAGRVADFYETKLQRSVDRVVGFVGPAAIIIISVIIGGLIISVMTSLLSITQLVG